MPVLASMTLASVLPWLQNRLLARRERFVEVEEAVAVPQASELIDHDRLEQRADVGAGHLVLGQAALEGVDVVDVAVSLLQLLLDRTLLVICAKLVTAGRPSATADLVVRADAVIPAPLDVESDQVLAAAHARHDFVEELVADFVDDLDVLRLSVAVGIALENGADAGGGQSGDRIDRRSAGPCH